MDVLSQMLAISLQNCVAKIGFMSNEHGDLCKKVLAINEDFAPAKIALGCYLDECIKDNNYLPLDRALTDFKDLK